MIGECPACASSDFWDLICKPNQDNWLSLNQQLTSKIENFLLDFWDSFFCRTCLFISRWMKNLTHPNYWIMTGGERNPSRLSSPKTFFGHWDRILLDSWIEGLFVSRPIHNLGLVRGSDRQLGGDQGAGQDSGRPRLSNRRKRKDKKVKSLPWVYKVTCATIKNIQKVKWVSN